MLALVAGVGSVVLFQGMNSINDVNFALALFESQGAESPRENLVIEHVRFNPTSDQVTISVRNVGTTEVTIKTITMVKIDTQELLLNDDTLETDLYAKEITDITKTASLDPLLATQWNDSDYSTSEYRISVTTERGNSFEEVAVPFNT
jgi:hypothetical protein